MSHAVRKMPFSHRLSVRLAALTALLVPVLAVIVAQPAPVSAQQVPAMQIAAFTCPGDVAIKDDLAKTCTEPRAGVHLTLAGPTNTDTTTGDNGVAQVDSLNKGTYTITDSTVESKSFSLIECNAVLGFDGFANLPVTYGKAPGTFSVDLTQSSGKTGTADACTWYVIPSGALNQQPSGLVLDAGVAQDTNSTGLVTIPADGTRAPISGAGPATPAKGTTTFSLLYETTMTTSQMFGQPAFSAQPGGETGNSAFPSVGPILLFPGDYKVSDTTNGFDTTVTVKQGEVLHVESLASPNGSGGGSGGSPSPSASSAPSGSGQGVTFDGTALQGGYTKLDQRFYGNQAAALYGAGSGYETGTLTFDYSNASSSARTTVSLLGLDDELAVSEPISVTLNGTEIYNGESTFTTWNPNATGLQWSHLDLTADAGLLRASGNTLVITDLAANGAINRPPWVMITGITISQ